MLAGIVVHSTATSIDRADLIAELTDSSALPSSLPAFLDALQHVANELEIDARVEQWDLWLRDVATSRLSVPDVLRGPEERAAWADLAISLELAPLLQLAATSPGPINSSTSFTHISVGFVQQNADLLVTSATDRLRVTTKIDWHVEHQLQALVEKVREQASLQLLRDLAEVSAQRGISDAYTWVDGDTG
jgi:hypothetical protein